MAASAWISSVTRERYLGPDSEMKVIQGAGHFLHVEQPAEVNQHILVWVTS